MISKTITAKHPFTQEPYERTLYFNLTKTEALEVNLMEDLESIGRSENPRKIIPVFKRIMKAAYGVKLPTGAFTKDEEETADFLASDHYSELFLGLLNDPEREKAVADFIKAILDFDVDELKNANNDSVPAPAPTRPQPQDYRPSAREIAAQEAAKKQENTVTDRQPLPSERHRVPASNPQAEFEASPEYQAFLKRQADEMDGNAQGIVELQPQPIEVHPAENAPSPIESYNNDGINQPAHQQALRRDTRED